VRFFLGAAEAGFFPGIIVYFSRWFRYEDRAKAIALFMAAIPIFNIIGSPLSGLLLGINWFGRAGWRWLFILEGAPAIILGIVTIFYLTDWPHQAGWLPDDERQWITSELEQEKQAKQLAHSFRVWEALRHREVILLTLAYFFMVTGVYGFNFWLPSKQRRVVPQRLRTSEPLVSRAMGVTRFLDSHVGASTKNNRMCRFFLTKKRYSGILAQS
jgi:MFS transporter, ACS family, tartrate transporter